MASVRLGKELEERVEAAAKLIGQSKSDFIRDAVLRHIDALAEDNPLVAIAHLVGKGDLDDVDISEEGIARAFQEEFEREKARWPRPS